MQAMVLGFTVRARTSALAGWQPRVGALRLQYASAKGVLAVTGYAAAAAEICSALASDQARSH